MISATADVRSQTPHIYVLSRDRPGAIFLDNNNLYMNFNKEIWLQNSIGCIDTENITGSIYDYDN